MGLGGGIRWRLTSQAKWRMVGGRVEKCDVRLGDFHNISEILRSGVYALVHKGKVVYIGKSKSMLGRIYTHRAQLGKKTYPWMKDFARGMVFDEVHIRPCHVDALDDLEAKMISLYKPKYNIHLKHPYPSDAIVTLSLPSGIQIKLNDPGPPRPKLEIRRI